MKIACNIIGLVQKHESVVVSGGNCDEKNWYTRFGARFADTIGLFKGKFNRFIFIRRCTG
jgi:hypothetical protein